MQFNVPSHHPAPQQQQAGAATCVGCQQPLKAAMAGSGKEFWGCPSTPYCPKTITGWRGWVADGPPKPFTGGSKKRKAETAPARDDELHTKLDRIEAKQDAILTIMKGGAE